MEFAFVVDPLTTLKAYKDSSVAMMRECARRGHQVFAIEPDALFLAGAEVRASARRIELLADDHDWFSGDEILDRPLTAFDCVLMRKDPPFDIEYVTATWLLGRAEAQGARIYNRPQALRDHSEKLAIAEFPAFTVPMVVARDSVRLNAFIDAESDVIVKPLDGMGGRGVFRVRRDDPNRNVILETLTADGTRTVIAQRFIPEIADGDKRIVLIDGKPLPWALARIPKPGETRGNLAAGGTGVARPLTGRDREIAAAVGPLLAGRGLIVVGLDVIGDWLTEINVTSPTCLVEIEAQTGLNGAAWLIDALERRCA